MAVQSQAEQRQLVQAELPDGGTISIRAVDLGGGPTDARAPGKLDLDDVAKSIHEVATVIGGAIKKVAPKRASITLGIDIAMKSGKLTGLLVEGGAAAMLRVTLEWGEPSLPGGEGDAE